MSPGVAQVIVVARLTITWATPGDIVYGTPLSGATLDATASVPGTFNYIPAAGTILQAGRGQVVEVRFTPTDTADYAGDTADRACKCFAHCRYGCAGGRGEQRR